MDHSPPRVETGPTPDMLPQGGPAPQHATGHEISDVSVRGIFIFTACLAVLSVCFHVIGYAVMAHFSDRANRLESRRPARFEDLDGQFPAPNLQESPNAERAAMRIEEQEEVAGYGWVDRDTHVARIPLNRAMVIYAESQGWPDPDAARTEGARAPTPKAARPREASPKPEAKKEATPKAEAKKEATPKETPPKAEEKKEPSPKPEAKTEAPSKAEEKKEPSPKAEVKESTPKEATPKAEEKKEATPKAEEKKQEPESK